MIKTNVLQKPREHVALDRWDVLRICDTYRCKDAVARITEFLANGVTKFDGTIQEHDGFWPVKVTIRQATVEDMDAAGLDTSRGAVMWDHGHYDALRNPADCLHCGGSQLAPSGGDSITPCGFCDDSVAPL